MRTLRYIHVAVVCAFMVGSLTADVRGMACVDSMWGTDKSNDSFKKMLEMVDAAQLERKTEDRLLSKRSGRTPTTLPSRVDSAEQSRRAGNRSVGGLTG